MRQTSPHPSKGFTLAELLISLAILGVIAAFAIPKVLQAQQEQKERAVFLETITTLNAIAYQGYQDRQLAAGTNHWSYFKDRLNATQLCDDSALGVCWHNTNILLDTAASYVGGALMHNGVMVAGICTASCPNTDRIYIDWNGTAGPNWRILDHGMDQDIFFLQCNYGSTTIIAGPPAFPVPIRPGTCGPGDGDPNIQFYINLFDPNSNLIHTGNQW